MKYIKKNEIKSKLVEEKNFNCPVCHKKLVLTVMEPSESVFYCHKCSKYFKNNNGVIGKEITNPYSNKNYIY